MTDIQKQIEKLDFENEILSQLTNLKAVIDLYEKNEYPSGCDDNDLIEKNWINPLSEAESLKCCDWLKAGKDLKKLTDRLDALNLRPKFKLIVKIPCTRAKQRYNNLLAFKQLNGI